MSDEPVLTLVGNLTADPVIRFTQRGDAVVNFAIAATPRSFDRTTDQWRDGETLFVNCSAWKKLAQNISDSLYKGSRVIAQGRLKSNSYQDRNGNDRRSIVFEVDEIGASLKFATANIQKPKQGDGWGGSFEAPGSDVAPF